MVSEQIDNLTPAETTPVAFAPMAPPRDLWPEIAADIEAGSSPRRWKPRLVPVGIAATLALATSLTMMTTQQVVERDDRGQIRQVADLMQVQQRAGLGALTSAVQGVGVDKAMDGLLAAEAEIRAAIDSGSNNPALLDMLANVHRHQLAIIDKSMKA